MISLLQGDCLERMNEIPDGSVDMVLCDLPYGTTACKWDHVIPPERLWIQYRRLLRAEGAIVLFGSQPFSSVLVASAPDLFRHAWVWDKVFAANFTLAKKQPLKTTEDILVFGFSGVSYTPEMSTRDKPIKMGKNVSKSGSANLASAKAEYEGKLYDKKYPSTILTFSNRAEGQKRLHPTQKPVDLLRYLIRTYTRPGETVLDNTMGSGSTAVAAIREGRSFVGIERDESYFKTAKERIESEMISDYWGGL